MRRFNAQVRAAHRVGRPRGARQLVSRSAARTAMRATRSRRWRCWPRAPGRRCVEYTPLPIDGRDPERLYRRVRYGPVEVFLLDYRSYRGVQQRQPPAGRPARRRRTSARRSWPGSKRALAASTARVEGDGEQPADRPGRRRWPRSLRGRRQRRCRAAARPRAGDRPAAPVHPRSSASTTSCGSPATCTTPRRTTTIRRGRASPSSRRSGSSWPGRCMPGPSGRTPLDPTFGPEVRFLGIPAGMKPNRPPSEGLQFFGRLVVEAATGALRASLHNRAGREIFSDHPAIRRTALSRGGSRLFGHTDAPGLAADLTAAGFVVGAYEYLTGAVIATATAPGPVQTWRHANLTAAAELLRAAYATHDPLRPFGGAGHADDWVEVRRRVDHDPRLRRLRARAERRRPLGQRRSRRRRTGDAARVGDGPPGAAGGGAGGARPGARRAGARRRDGGGGHGAVVGDVVTGGVRQRRRATPLRPARLPLRRVVHVGADQRCRRRSAAPIDQRGVGQPRRQHPAVDRQGRFAAFQAGDGGATRELGVGRRLHRLRVGRQDARDAGPALVDGHRPGGRGIAMRPPSPPPPPPE